MNKEKKLQEDLELIKKGALEIIGEDDLMSLPGDLISRYYELLTDMSMEDIHQIKLNMKDGTCHPRDIKMDLAF